MALKPWHKVVEPREDLRKGRPLDASEFAVHLDKVREGTAPDEADAGKPEAASGHEGAARNGEDIARQDR